MVRVINQQTFDDVVKENMEEFGMAVEEAIEEAIQQFEAQGVNLSNIVKSVAMVEGKDPLVACIRQLQDLLKQSRSSPLNLVELLDQLREDCDKDLVRRVLAGKEGAYPTVLDILDKFNTDDSIRILCLRTLTSLMNGYPDLLDGRGVKTITTLLSTTQHTLVMQHVLRWARVCCINHEHNRQMIMDEGVISGIRSLTEEDVPTLLPEVCGLIRVLTLDDDVRTNVSKAHVHASSLAVEVLCPLTNFLAKYKNDKNLVLELLLTINSLIVRNEFCAKVDEAGGINFAIDLLVEHSDDERIVCNCLMMLKGLAGNDDVKQKIMQAGASSLIMLALTRHQKSPIVCNAGLSCVTILSLRSQDNSKTFVEQGAVDIILQIMKVHPQIFKVQRQCCWAIRNIVSRSPSLKEPFLKQGVEELINAARQQHKEIDYDGKSALRDLGCKVDFNEQWKGEGKQAMA